MIDYNTMLGVLSSLILHKDKIEAALSYQFDEGFTFQHVFDMVKNEQALFFWNDTSCAVIEIRKFPGQLTLHVFLGAGTTDGLLELYERVAAWGRTVVGATKMTTLCRKGFRRKLAKHDWKETQVWLIKDITAAKESVQ